MTEESLTPHGENFLMSLAPLERFGRYQREKSGYTAYDVASCPNASFAELEWLWDLAPEEILDNPVLPLLALEDPARADGLIYVTRRELARLRKQEAPSQMALRMTQDDR